MGEGGVLLWGLLGWGSPGRTGGGGSLWRGAAPDPLSLPSVNFVKWSSQGMLRMSPEAMGELFQPTISQIIKHIGRSRGWEQPGCPRPPPQGGSPPSPGRWHPEPCPVPTLGQG